MCIRDSPYPALNKEEETFSIENFVLDTYYFKRNFQSKITPSLFSISILLFLVACQSDSVEHSGKKDQNGITKIFQLLPSTHTNITFENTLSEGLNTNVLMYEYFYNGGGVATGDFNGDGFIDIYFTSNMGSNQLYLNNGKGDLKEFKEIAKIAGVVGRPGPWKTGVTLVDINGDDRLDIYLCYSGALPLQKRQNQLFINQGNDANGIPKFSEQAAAYGIDSPAFSNQAYFFDYDRDGDLDMLLLNHNPKSIPVLNEVSTKKYLAEDDQFKGLRLFQQGNSGAFKDITKQAGIIGSSLSYGLGIGISDINKDGWPDFYVSNDYTIPDYLYINNQNGTFRNDLTESVRYNSHFSMGNDIADINNDGWQDIITLDMLPEDKYRQRLLMAPDNYSKFDLNIRSGFYYQYMRNMLQLNNGDPNKKGQVTFSEIGQLSGIAATDWSWAALAADYDNDGWKDLYITNGYHRDYTNLDFIKYMDDFVQSKGRLQREDVLEIIKNMPASDVLNYMYANQDGHTFSNNTKAWGLNQHANSNGAAYADLDNDGDLDLIVNNINKPAFIYQNNTAKTTGNYLQINLHGAQKNTKGIGAVASIAVGNNEYTLEQYPTRGYLSAVSPTLHFGIGKATSIKSLTITWPSGKISQKNNISSNQVLDMYEKEAAKTSIPATVTAPIFKKITPPITYKNPKQNTRDFDRQQLLISEISHQGPCMLKGDFNGDGLEDIFIGGSIGQAASIYFQGKSNRFSLQTSTAFETDKSSEDTDAAILDANGDGHPDIYVASGGYHQFQIDDPLLQDRLYMNDGKGKFTKKSNALPKLSNASSTIAVNDINGDGYDDLFVGSNVIPGRYPETPKSVFLINDGKGKFTNQIEQIAPSLESIGMVKDAVWIDLNNDEQKDLVVVGEWMPVSAFISKDEQLDNQTQTYFPASNTGWWNTIAVADFNKDGQQDLLVGNTGSNTPFQVSSEEPAEIHFKDFDQNGSVDPFFSFYNNGKSYPYANRDELVGQLAQYRSTFTSYEQYAKTQLKDIFSANELDDATHLKASNLKTSLFLSNTDGTYSENPLPIEVQYAPVNAIAVFDYDKDGSEDVLLCGNNSHTRLRMGKFDANYGTLLKGDGQGNFQYIPQAESGFRVKGDVHSILQLNDILYFGINQKPLEAYKLIE